MSSSENTVGTPKKKPSIIIKLILILIFAALISIGTLFAYIKISGNKDVVVEQMYSIPAETYNLKPSESGSYAKISMSLAYTDNDVLKAIEKDIAMIKDAIILTLSDKEGSDLITSDQKDALKKEILKKLNSSLIKYNGKLDGKGITNIYFDSFVIS